MKRIRINKGNIFQINLENGKRRFFQYLMLDPVQLHSEVIRVFKIEKNEKDVIDLSEIVNSEVDFYSHVDIKFGIVEKKWERIGSLPIEEDFKRPFFRLCGDMPPPGENKTLGKSYNWYIWELGQSFDEMRYIGELSWQYQNIDDGAIVPPKEIIHRINKGTYSFSKGYFT